MTGSGIGTGREATGVGDSPAGVFVGVGVAVDPGSGVFVAVDPGSGVFVGTVVLVGVDGGGVSVNAPGFTSWAKAL